MREVADCLGLWSIRDVFIEAVTLENPKENAENAEQHTEVGYIDQLNALLACIHDHLDVMKHSQCCPLVPIPVGFCCLLSLELMTTLVIDRMNLLPNYTDKTLIAN
ncbi:hypothetical protein Nepgr_024072 [Nepenthes gracilis]|uniref:Uncharacterized protein n=1 Tax=Nepenthes gracilis TaxID=150966 RepID=A0AAD3XZP9_NEPGR|nr:hypothetical protein Nepgr_024072 [Nepenthes gracilis]